MKQEKPNILFILTDDQAPGPCAAQEILTSIRPTWIG